MKKVSKFTDKLGQWTGEKLNRFESTKLQEEFVDLERRTDATDELLKNLAKVTEEYLQPNSEARAKLGSGKSYDMPEDAIADVLARGALGLPDSILADAMTQLSTAEREVAEARMGLDNAVVSQVVRPLQEMREDMKVLQSNRRRLDSRRLDYDAKRRAWEKKTTDAKIETDFHMAESKFEESKELVFNGMMKAMENEPEHCRQLLALVQAQMEFYKQALDALTPLGPTLEECIQAAANRPSAPAYQRPRSTSSARGLVTQRNVPVARTTPRPASSSSASQVPLPKSRPTGRDSPTPPARPAAPQKTSLSGNWVVVLHDFEAQSRQELDLRKGDRVEVLQTLDDNWMEGRFKGQTGIFPVNFVQQC